MKRVEFSDLPAYTDHVLVDGAFDPIHASHIAYLESARCFGPLLCAVASDDQIRAKGREPLLPQASRVAVLEALEIVSAVYPKQGPTERVIEKMGPRAYIKGEDWRDRLPPEQVSACERVGVPIHFVDTPGDSSTARLRAWARSEDAKHLERLERLVQSQQPASTPWQPVTDYSFEARKAIEGKHPELIKEVFQPKNVLDAGCGPGHLVRMLHRLGMNAFGFDLHPPVGPLFFRDDLCSDAPLTEWDTTPLSYDLVVNRECLEHLTIPQIRRAVTNLCRLSSKFIYVTTRFAQSPDHLLSVDTSDDLDPTHITMLNQSLLRLLFVLEGFVRRPDLETRMDWMQKGRVLVYERPQ